MKNSWDATLTIQEFWHDNLQIWFISSEMLGGLNHNFGGIQPRDNGDMLWFAEAFFSELEIH